MQRKIVPNIVQRQSIASVLTTDSARDAAAKMADGNFAAVVVVDGKGKLIGIVTERDMSQKVVAKGWDAEATPISKIMTKNPDTLGPDDSAGDALELMQTRRYRHLPVVEDGQCVGMVSIRDLYAAVKSTLEEDIRETEAFVFGDRYGA